jgi:group II intron reverse transcriptase/maturase
MSPYSNQEKVQRTIAELKAIRRKKRTDQDKVRLLQLQLYDKAKQEKRFCFYVLYDKIFQLPVLRLAYAKVRANGGIAGVDKQSFKDIEEMGLSRFLEELSEELRKQTYHPEAVKRVWIEKSGGGKRPLGIPTIRDRVAQAACKLVIEPIFEADFEDHSYGFRPNRSSQDALAAIKEHLEEGYWEVYDADLSKYFDTIPHDKLQIALKQRISDPRVLRLIKKWLKVPIQEEDGTYTGGKGRKEGTPQGGVISPLLSNIYLHLLDKIVAQKGGRFDRAGIKMIRYADDFILMSKRLEAEILQELSSLLDRMGLKINEEKTQVVDATVNSFDFLGFTVRYDQDIFGRAKKYWNIRASEKSCKKIRQKINEQLKRMGHYSPEHLVEELNPIIRGWINYFKIDKVSYVQVQLSDLDNYLSTRLHRYYKRKSQRGTNLHGPQAYQMLTQKYGLIKPYKPSVYRPAKASKRNPIEKAVCGKTARTV